MATGKKLTNNAVTWDILVTLANSEDDVDNAAIAAGSSESITSLVSGTVVTATVNTGADSKGNQVTGRMDSFTVDNTGALFTADDSETTAILDSAVNAGILAKDANDQYNFVVADDELALNNQAISVTFQTLGDGDVISIETDSTVTFSNKDQANTLVMANTTGSVNLGTVMNETSLDIPKAQAYMDVIDLALTELNTNRSEFGSTQNQLESGIRNMQTTEVNLLAAESVIRDVDYAAESANFNKQNIIAQAGTYAMSQANAIQQNVTRLLQ